MPVSEITTTLQNTILESIESTQKLALGALENLADIVRPLVPEVPPVDGLPTPAEAIENTFGFAEKVLAAQRQFATKAIAALTPTV